MATWRPREAWEVSFLKEQSARAKAVHLTQLPTMHREHQLSGLCGLDFFFFSA